MARGGQGDGEIEEVVERTGGGREEGEVWLVGRGRFLVLSSALC